MKEVTPRQAAKLRPMIVHFPPNFGALRLWGLGGEQAMEVPAKVFVMSPWRRRVVELFPDLERDLNSDFTPYTVFMRLLMRCREAHEQGNETELIKIYGFAEWCHWHTTKDLWNAAGVSSYEHLGDAEITLQNIPRYVKPDVFEDVSDLLKMQMGNSKFARIRSEFRKYHNLK